MTAPKSIDPKSLYEAHGVELPGVAARLRQVYHHMQARGESAVFGDVEGELAYLLIRAWRPAVVVEMSPDCGWSTNYLLAALTANGHGTLHSFEIEPLKNGRPTEEVIRENLHPDWDRPRLSLRIGDARRLVDEWPRTIDFLFIDSCHEADFADWYMARVFPRVRGPVLVHDVAFRDRLEASGEADHLWSWAGRERIPLVLAGLAEMDPWLREKRRDIPRRRAYRSNAAAFLLPQVERAELPRLGESLESRANQALRLVHQGRPAEADALATRLADLAMTEVDLANRHRVFLTLARVFRELDQAGEAERMLWRALGAAAQDDRQQRLKGLAELEAWFQSAGRPDLAARARGLGEPEDG